MASSAALLAAACALVLCSLVRGRTYVVAHRGASGIIPEHTVPAYELAIAQGADFIECDVVLTKDLAMVCRHEPNLLHTTNAGELFPELLRNVTIDNETAVSILAADLTLAQIRMLRARQVHPFRDQSWNGMFQIPTLQEFINVALAANRTVGLYPECKHPSWHNKLPALRERGLRIEQMVLEVLHRNGFNHAFGTPSWLQRPAFVQAFELSSLAAMKAMTPLPLVMLLGSAGEVAPDSGRRLEEMMSDEGLDEIARYATGVGPSKDTLVRVQEGVLVSTGLVKRFHERGLLVHPYTFRDEARYILAPLQGLGPLAEFEYFLKHEGVDGVFTDFPGTLAGGVLARGLTLGLGPATVCSPAASALSLLGVRSA